MRLRKIAPQDAEQIELAMRQVVDAVAIQIDFERAAPKIADTVYGPLACRKRPSRRSPPDADCARKYFL